MFEFTEEYEPLLREVREIAEKVVKPRAKEIEESDEFPVDMANRFFKEGYLQILIPKQLGGMGKDVTSFCIISEEIAKVSASMALLVIVQSVGTLHQGILRKIRNGKGLVRIFVSLGPCPPSFFLCP
jgi:alkylation response protein AidB-like acyl-CoA dehydrogenase